MTLLAVVGSSFSFSALVPPDATVGPTILGTVAGVLVFLVVAGWVLLPAGATAYLVVRAARSGWLPLVLAELGSLGVVLLTVWALNDYVVSDSSTDVLVFAVLPVVQAFPLVGAVVLLGVVRPGTFAKT